MVFVPRIIYEDPDFLVIDKPAGMLVHYAIAKSALPSRHCEEPRDEAISVVDWLLKKYPEIKNVGDDPETRPGIVHRLDKDASGLMIVCRVQAVFDYFKKQFQERRIKKTYLAIVHGVPKKELRSMNHELWTEIKEPIGLKPDTIKRTTHLKKAKMIKEAVTKYKVIKSISGHFALLEIQPLTGRTHQIRVHLASIGHPIVGDRIYGSKKQVGDKLLLRAAALEFTDPAGKRLKIETDLPNDFHI